MSLYLKEIRGEVNTEITNEYASNLGGILGNFLSTESRINLGRDDEPASQMISRALTAGIMASGKSVADFGVVPTPVAHFLSSFLNGNLLLIITTHHNIVSIAIYSNYQIHLKQKRPENVHGEDLGRISHVNILMDTYQKSVLEQINHQNIKTKKPKIILGCEDKNVIPYISEILNSLGVETVIITYGSGDNINRRMEVEPENISLISSMVKSISADLGIILVNNGERAIFIDENGDTIRDQTILSIFAMDMLKRQRGTVISSVVASLSLDDVVNRYQGKLKKTGVNSILRELENPDVIFAGDEPGLYIFPQFQLCSDGIFASIMLLDMICSEDKPLSKLASEIPEYNRTGFSVPCDHELKSYALDLLKKELEDKGDLTTDDGVRADLKNSYILIRPSSFQPRLKIYLEAKSPAELNKLTEEINKVLNIIQSS
ncbi:MAG: hypothetical protein LUQ24_03205 [Methanobacterium sp.]|jgi:phosphomannomutase|nr:hypothetical protein [Methanobacterium sp.]